MSSEGIPEDAKIWEAAVRKLRGGFMPPQGARQHPDRESVNGLISWLENTLDAADVTPHPGRVPLRRLNRREYANAVRDLVGIEVDAGALLPVDDKKDGVDNNAASLQVSPSFLDQYLTAARQVALQAVGNPKAPAVTATYGPVADMVISLPPRGTPDEGTQQLHKDGLLFGTRGGMSIEHIFPADGDYALTIGDMALGRDVPRTGRSDFPSPQFRRERRAHSHRCTGRRAGARAGPPLADHEAELGDPAAFLEGAYRSVFLAYVPD
jgi:hypothetical protein